MRCRLTLAVVAAFVGGSSIAAHAQAPVAVKPGAGVAGTRVGGGGRGIGQQPAGTGGLQDRGNVGSFTGGIALGRGMSAGSGGTGNEINLGGNSGGTKE